MDPATDNDLFFQNNQLIYKFSYSLDINEQLENKKIVKEKRIDHLTYFARQRTTGKRKTTAVSRKVGGKNDKRKPGGLGVSIQDSF